MLPNLKAPLSLRNAAEILGRKLFSMQSKPNMLENLSPEMLITIRKALYQIFSSGKVTVVLRDEDGEATRPLERHHARHTCFDIRVLEDTVRLGHLPGYSFGCEIDADEFTTLLAGLVPPMEAPANQQARVWLSACVNREGAPRQTKAQYRRQAISEFGIPAATFDKIWREVIRKEEGTNPQTKWGKPGRPSGRQKS